MITLFRNYRTLVEPLLDTMTVAHNHDSPVVTHDARLRDYRITTPSLPTNASERNTPGQFSVFSISSPKFLFYHIKVPWSSGMTLRKAWRGRGSNPRGSVNSPLASSKSQVVGAPSVKR